MESLRFDASVLLDTRPRRASYLAAAFETGDPEQIRDAFNVVARACGLAEVAFEASLDRTGLCTAPIGNVYLEIGTVVQVLSSLGIRLESERNEALKELARLGQEIDSR
jgi:probable addiction module antidote protein